MMQTREEHTNADVAYLFRLGCRAAELICFARRTAAALAESETMKSARICLALLVMLAPCAFSGQSAAEQKSSPIDSADRLFQTGEFGHDFFKRYAVTFDFENMKIVLQR
jgi:hypothetical protein